mgnify:CR=1 FL=1
MFIVGAVPDSLLSMKKKPKQKGYKLTEPKDKKPSHKSYWSKVTGGRMK